MRKEIQETITNRPDEDEEDEDEDEDDVEDEEDDDGWSFCYFRSMTEE